MVSGTATFEGAARGITPTQDSHFTTKAYVDTIDSSFQSQITLNDGDIGYLQVATGDLFTRVTGNDADITALQTATGSLQTHVASNDGDISTLQTATGSLQTQVSNNDTDISNLNTATGSLQTQVTSNDTDISDLSGIAVMRSGEQTISGVKTFAEDVNILGSLAVSGDFILGDETTDKIITRGDLIVEDTVSVTGDATFAGSVGIGTDSPTSDLHISDAATPQMKIQDTTNNVVAIVYADDTKAFIGSDTNHPVHIGVSGNSHLTINANGNVGVGKF